MKNNNPQLVPDDVKDHLELLYDNIQDAGVDGGETTSEAIDKLYQRKLSEVPK